MEGLRLGLVGCGGRAGFHIRGLETCENTNIVAVCDLDEARANERATSLGATAYTDLDKMLAQEGLDGVIIATAAVARGGPELACVEANIPFLVEKPVAVDMETARKVAEKVRESGVITCVGYQLRYSEVSRAIARWSADRKIGLIEGRYWCGAARTHMRTGPDQLLEQVTHTFDLIRFFAGEIEEVFGYEGRNLLDGDGLPDVHAVAIKLANGAIGTVSSTWGSGNHSSQTNNLNLFAGDEKVEYRRTEAIHNSADVLEPVAGMTIHEAFVHAIRTGDRSQILTPYEEGVKSLAIPLAATLSAKTGRPVRVADL